jgi:hypothetical protein
MSDIKKAAFRLAQRNPEFREALAREIQAAALGPYVDTVIDGLTVTQVNTDNRRSGAKIKGNKLLIKWGLDAPEGSFVRKKYLPKWVKWAQRQLGKKKERIQQRKEWSRTKIDGFSVYDVEGKEEVAAILGKIKRDVQPLLRAFGLSFTTMKESVAEGSLGFNRGRRTIALNVRQKANPMKLRKYSAIMRTMIHEIAHLKHMNHSRAFSDFDNELLLWARENGIYKPH